MPDKSIRDVLEGIYVSACLDTIKEENKGKGKELCRIKVDQALSELCPNRDELKKDIKIIKTFIKYKGADIEVGVPEALENFITLAERMVG